MGDHWIGVPGFGGWGTFIRSFPEALQAAGLDIPGPVVVRDVLRVTGPACRPASGHGARRGLVPDPAYLAWLFTSGTRLAFRARGWSRKDPETVRKVTVEVRGRRDAADAERAAHRNPIPPG